MEERFLEVCDRFKLTSYQRQAFKSFIEAGLELGIEFDLELSAIRFSYLHKSDLVAERILPSELEK